MADRADAVVARRSDPVNRLRVAWKQKARQYRADATHVGSENLVLAWQGRAVLPHDAPSGSPDIATIVDRDGTRLRLIEAPSRAQRTPAGPIVTWPEEGLVAGVHVQGGTFQLVWIELDGVSHTVNTEPATTHQDRYQLSATTTGGVMVSRPIHHANLDDVGWQIDVRLDAMYGTPRRAAFDDFAWTTELVTREGRQWDAPGRVGAIADDVAIFEEGSGPTDRHIVARRASDGGELWRKAGTDSFVLGSIPMPAWSDDRVYVLDRGARRKQAWAREFEVANIHRVSADDPMRTILSMRPVSRARLEPLTAPSTLHCLSTRTGESLWHVDVGGDVVSFRCHASWVAAVITGNPGKLRVWRHDGTPVGEGTAWLHAPSMTNWPPDPGHWPCIAWGEDAHLVVAQNRTTKDGGPRLYLAPIEAPDAIRWETPLPAPAVHMQLFRNLRLENRVPMAFVEDGAFLRWGKQLYGLLP